MLLNGPESFTPDGNFILGEAPELRGYFVCAGFNSAGIANSGGAGQADRRVDRRRRGAARPVGRRHPPLRRRSRPTASALAERTGETLGLHYAMRWPRQELETARPLRTLAAVRPARGQGRGVRHARTAGSARTTSCRAGAARASRTRSARPAGCRDVLDEQRATREAVGAVRPDVVRQVRCCKGRDALARAAAPVRQRDGRRRRAHGLHARC